MIWEANQGATFSMTANIDMDLWRKLVDPTPDSDWTFGTIEQEQIRKHKKRRINKKWAKKYGYREKFKNIGKGSFTQDGDTITATIDRRASDGV